MILPFGKHSGKQIVEVPKSYLRWLNEQVWFRDEHPWLASEVRRLLGTSGAEFEPEQQSSIEITTDVLKTWRREVLKKWHPDRDGGSHEAFVAVTDAVQTLGEMLARQGAA